MANLDEVNRLLVETEAELARLNAQDQLLAQPTELRRATYHRPGSGAPIE